MPFRLLTVPIANGQGMQQAYTLMALQSSDIGKSLGLDKMTLSELQWVPLSPQSYGLSEVELNTAVIQQLVRQGGMNPETATWEQMKRNPGVGRYLWENFKGIPEEQLMQIIPGLASGRTAEEYRKSVAAQRARPTGIMGEESLTERAAHRQAQNVTDMAGLRTLAGEIQDSMKEFFTGVLAKVSRDHMTDSNDVYKGDWVMASNTKKNYVDIVHDQKRVKTITDFHAFYKITGITPEQLFKDQRCINLQRYVVDG